MRRGSIAGERGEVPRLCRVRLRLVLGNRSDYKFTLLNENAFGSDRPIELARRAGSTLSTLKRNRRSGGLFGQVSIYVNRSVISYIAPRAATALPCM